MNTTNFIAIFYLGSDKLRAIIKLPLLLVIVVSVVFTAKFPAFAQEIPLPDDIRVEKPEESLPPEIKKLVGVWEGEWKWMPGGRFNNPPPNVTLKAILIVEKVHHQSAQIIYAWGDNQHWRTTKGWRRYEASLLKTDNKIELTFVHTSPSQVTYQPRRTVTFFINDKGKLEGKQSFNLDAYIEMVKKETPIVPLAPKK